METKSSSQQLMVDSIEHKIAESLRGYGFDKISRVPVQTLAAEFLSVPRAVEQLNLIERYAGSLSGKQLLEIGSGYGLLVAIATTLFECDAMGLEPGEDAYFAAHAISLELLKTYALESSRIVNGFGENIPFNPGTFDVVYSSNVLEHVQQPAKVLDEALRVLKPGGIAVIVFPNYGSWWEGHYGLPMIPNCPKSVYKLWVRLFGRDPSFIDTLRFLSYKDVSAWSAAHSGEIETMSTGLEVWEERMKTLEFSEWAALGSLKQFLKVLRKLRLLPVVSWLGRTFHWETPFILVFKKTAIDSPN